MENVEESLCQEEVKRVRKSLCQEEVGRVKEILCQEKVERVRKSLCQEEVGKVEEILCWEEVERVKESLCWEEVEREMSSKVKHPQRLTHSARRLVEEGVSKTVILNPLLLRTQRVVLNHTCHRLKRRLSLDGQRGRRKCNPARDAVVSQVRGVK